MFYFSAVYLEFLTTDQLVVGQGYPAEITSNGVGNTVRYTTLALLYAYGAPDNDLCASAMSQNRKRRDLPGKFIFLKHFFALRIFL